MIPQIDYDQLLESMKQAKQQATRWMTFINCETRTPPVKSSIDVFYAAAEMISGLRQAYYFKITMSEN